MIETLKRLPRPEYDNQTMSVPIVKSIDYSVIKKEISKDATEKFIVVVAQRYRQGHEEWLGWMCDI